MPVTRNRTTLWIACFMFLALGIITAGVGPSLVALAANTGTRVGTVGIIFTALFGGALIAQLITGILIERFSARWIIVAALLMIGVGTVLFSVAPSIAALFLFGAITGLGHGCIDVSTNLTIARLDSARSTANLNLINMFFGIGAVIGPVIIGLALRAGAQPQVGLWAGAAMMGICVPLVALLFTPRDELAGDGSGRTPAFAHAQAAGRGAGSLVRSPLLWMLGLLILLGVGLEQGTGGWTSTYTKLSLGLGDDIGALISSAYWLTFTIGRLVTIFVSNRIRPAELLRLCLAGTFVAGALLPIGIGNTALTVLGITLLGLCIGPLFPTAFAYLTEQFEDNAAHAAGVFTAMGSIGGLSLTALQGALIERISPFVGALYMMIIAAMLFGCCLAIIRLGRAGRRTLNVPLAGAPAPAGD